ncbi:MAG: recombinase family protein [Clostridia bacterium]|nr:recombinase family protein [Clostridia bacterium]
MEKKICGYCRTAQENFDDINLQIETLKNFANKNGFTNLVIFADNGASGMNSDRKEFQKLLNLIKSDKVSTLIVKDISRLGRNYVDVGNLINVILPKHNVRLISVDGSIDSKKSTDKFLQLQKIISKLYEENKSMQKNKLLAKRI